MLNPINSLSTDPDGTPGHPRRRIFHLLTVVATIALLFGFIARSSRGKTPIPPPPTQDLGQQLALSDTSTRIVMQQLDEVFDTLAASIQARGELTEQDATLLKRWKEYDEQFLIANRNNPSQRYMRANARFRLGIINQMLGDYAQSVVNFQKAATILETLVEESPDLPSYRGELVFCRLNAAENALALKDKKLASDCLKELDRQLQRPELANSTDSQQFQQALRSLKTRFAALP